MRRRWIFSTGLVATAALAVAPLGGAAAQSDKATKLACTLALNAQGAPNPSAIHLGSRSARSRSAGGCTTTPTR